MEFQPTRNRSILISKLIQRNPDRPLNRVSKFNILQFCQIGEWISELSEDETEMRFQGNQARR